MFRPDQDRAVLMADSLRTVAGVVLLTALGLAPLNYGSTRLMPFETLIALVATAAAAWLLSAALARRWARPPWVACAGWLLAAASAAAWALALEPPPLPAFSESHYERLLARFPYSMTPRDAGLLLAWAAAGLAAWVVWCDLLREEAWRRSAAAVLLAAGAGVALLGLIQNATHARGIYWQPGPRMPGAFFGTFYHHTSAGAYLNTVWPVGLGLALDGLQRGLGNPRRELLVHGSLAAALLVLAAHFGHVSRAPQVIAAMVLLAFGIWVGLWRLLARRHGLRPLLGGAAIALGLAVAGLGATRTGDIRARWQLLRLDELRGGGAAAAAPPVAQWGALMRDDLFVPSDHRRYPLGDRGAAYAAALGAVRERPWFGWGPGGWTAAAAAHSSDPFVRTFFLLVQFTHSDPLQAAVEWGLVGAAGWTVLLGGGLVTAVRRLRAVPERDFLAAAAVAGLTAVGMQALFDFPLQIPAIAFNALTLAAFAWSAREPNAVRPV